MKRGLAKLEETETAWETLAPGDKFYNTSLAQYKAKVQLIRDADALVENLDQQIGAARNRKNDLTKDALALEKSVGKAIAGDPNHGVDSDLYEGTGRVRESERKTGLTRGKKNDDDK